MMSNLLYPESFENIFLGERIANLMEDRTGYIQQTNTADFPRSVIIRTKNDAKNIVRLFEEIDAQQTAQETEVILVDTESTDGTVDIAKSYGATVINIAQADFTYPKSLNLGMQAASYDAFLTVGHANLSNKQMFNAMSARFSEPNVVAAFGEDLPGLRASRTERIAYPAGVYGHLRKTTKVSKFVMGVLGATRAAVSKDVWQELGGFDENYASGGEDSDLAKRILANGKDIVREPALSVHHSHGLSPWNNLKQFVHWMSITKGPQAFDKDKLAQRRPDLGLN